jgi:hypothetical protein
LKVKQIICQKDTETHSGCLLATVSQSNECSTFQSSGRFVHPWKRRCKSRVSQSWLEADRLILSLSCSYKSPTNSLFGRPSYS